MEPEGALVRLAAAAADGAPLDWRDAYRGVALPSRTATVLEAVAENVRARARVASASVSDPLSLGFRLLCLLAATRALSGLGLAIANSDFGLIGPLLVFGFSGAALLYSGDRDPRAIRLGVFYVVVAATFATRPIAAATSGAASGVSLLAGLQPDAFLAATFLALLLRFPAAPAHLPAQVGLVRLEKAAAALGLFLFLVTPVAVLASGSPLGEALIVVGRDGGDGRGRLFWAAQFSVMALGARLALRKARLASGDEGRRVAGFVVAVFVGLAPLVLLTLVSVLVPGAERWVDRYEAATDTIVYGGLLSLPVTTAAAVAAGRVLGLRLLARRALSHALARTTLHLLVFLPALLLALYLFAERHRPLAELLGAGPGKGLLAALALSTVLRVLRRPIQAGLDRLFSRGDGDRGAGLQRLLTALSAARGQRDVAAALTGEVRMSLGATQVRVLTRNSSGTFAGGDSACRPLSASSAIVAMLDADPRPLEITPRLLALLPDDDRAWSSDLGVTLVVPVMGSTGQPAAILALGERVSEEPWDRGAQELAHSLASAAGIAIARVPQPGAAEGGEWDDEPGLECDACTRVRAHSEPRCECGADRSRQAALPRIALGKFRLVRRVGQGGMGVVYEAEDTTLGRTVALKTLPRSSPALAARLRSEARVMASINHPGVATLFGAETWKGVPFLVVEYLAGETLADRLTRGPLGLEASLSLGRALATTLADLHDEGLLHRDIKPGNVGFQVAGPPKLLDFGLAHLMELSADQEGCVAGTPRYLPPEAWEGVAPSPEWDVWALAVVIYEAIAGSHPFQGATEEITLRTVRQGSPARLDASRTPEWLASLLRGALAAVPGRRSVRDARGFAKALWH